MTTDPASRLDKLGKRISEERLKHRIEAPSNPAEPQPLTTVFDDWNEEIRRNDQETGRLSPAQLTAAVIILGLFVVLLHWCAPA